MLRGVPYEIIIIYKEKRMSSTTFFDGLNYDFLMSATLFSLRGYILPDLGFAS